MALKALLVLMNVGPDVRLPVYVLMMLPNLYIIPPQVCSSFFGGGGEQTIEILTALCYACMIGEKN